MGKKKALLKLDDSDRNADVTERLLSDPSENDPRSSESPMLVRRRRNARTIWFAIIALSSGILVFIGVLTILRAVQDANNLVPTKRPNFPTQYEASITVNMPYINLIEPLYVHVNADRGLQKLSYYGDSDIYIFNTSGSSYQIIPVIKELKCFRSDPEPIQHVFPNMSLFEPQHGVTLVHGRSCLSWRYVTPGNDPTPAGWKGEYTLYVDQTTEKPVRFHYIGRNPMLGGSHIDEYYLDYEYIREGPVDDHVFSTLPSMMNCSDATYLYGPKRTPGLDLHMMMPEGENKKQEVFDEFKDKHDKNYDGEGQELDRMTNYHHNLRYINAMNRKGLSYHLAPNAFADLSHTELMRMHHPNMVKRAEDNGANDIHDVSGTTLPDEFDWRQKGAVTPVKDQGSCGSCWTFGTTGAIEGALYMQRNKLYNLSEQSLMDCSWEFGNNACNGGLDYQAYQWIMDAGGIESADTYGGYRNVPGYCHFNRSNAVTSLTGFVNVTGLDAFNDALVTIGPLSVSIDASLPSFYFYAGGYYEDEACKSDTDSLDHSVLAVGVTTHNGQKYTIIKNSWSTHWGENGYALISQKNNLCGVATAATYPTLAKE
ncbi:hypothetical protein Poli38472_012861 [Pythium oligandrum]|uniref:Uncharacterized protein n=1 Tax=Pythium oligandrum TaxID=41045 RepID=A0A8K1CIL1_PYTOL|nr:hypothetical protein Poli38472_012861 [Pythium oligandrum]|eukprot:TMW64239.1 hypothetical protein Poli38472_012861 [Pythium oligandrum]